MYARVDATKKDSSPKTDNKNHKYNDSVKIELNEWDFGRTPFTVTLSGSSDRFFDPSDETTDFDYDRSVHVTLDDLEVRRILELVLEKGLLKLPGMS